MKLVRVLSRKERKEKVEQIGEITEKNRYYPITWKRQNKINKKQFNSDAPSLSSFKIS